MLRSTIYTLITVAAAAVLVATLWMPVLRIYGTSMAPTLTGGDLVVSVKGNDFQSGDIIAFYYNNKILVKRVIAEPGDWVDIDETGTVYVNNQELAEPYLEEKDMGDCNIDLPYQVPENRLFVMGDPQSHVCGFTKFGFGLCGGGADRRKAGLPSVAIQRFWRYSLRKN